MATLPDKIRDKLKVFVFRRVSMVSHQQLYQMRYYTNPDAYTKITNVTAYSKEEVAQNIEFRYHNYYGWSSKTLLRENDNFSDKYIFFEKKIRKLRSDSAPNRTRFYKCTRHCSPRRRSYMRHRQTRFYG